LGYTAIEKVLGRTSGLPGTKAGDVVNPEPDMIMIHDGLVQMSRQALDGIGINRLASPAKVMMVSDHDVLYGSSRAAERGAFNRKTAREWGVAQFYDAGQGGHGHIFPMEQGKVLPGMFYFDNDTHATNAGAVGAFGLRVGTEISRVLATGTTWVEVPKTVLLELRGRLPQHVYARDIGLTLAGQIKRGKIPFNLDYRVLEYSGDLDQFGLGERVALCSSPPEMRAAGVFVPPSAAILDYCGRHAQREFTPVYSDPDAIYEARHLLDLANVAPQVALPGNLGNAVDVGEAAGTAVDHAFIGSCGSGMYEDLLCAAGILKGRRIAAGVRLFIVPGSQASLQRIVAEGLMQIFLDAGAMILPPGCGPCNDAVVGPVARGEVSISTAPNNNAGRFGAIEAKLFLGSPATVAASALAGKITDPRTISVDAALHEQRELAYV
jgi:3-isopropylmalate/(R)-2-methylmalate dehydratase large subunit